jgi:hypothetical protein
MSEPTHRTVEANGIRIHFAEQGSGPLVLLCHGFPESWYSWRHQLVALSAAGFHAVAPDMRGYGLTDRPAEIERYTLFHLVGDMVGVLDALGEMVAHRGESFAVERPPWSWDMIGARPSRGMPRCCARIDSARSWDSAFRIGLGAASHRRL